MCQKNKKGVIFRQRSRNQLPVKVFKFFFLGDFVSRLSKWTPCAFSYLIASVRISAKKGAIDLSLICRKKMPLKKGVMTFWRSDFWKKVILEKSDLSLAWLFQCIWEHQLNLCKMSLKWVHSNMRNQLLTGSNPLTSGFMPQCEMSVLN